MKKTVFLIAFILLAAAVPILSAVGGQDEDVAASPLPADDPSFTDYIKISTAQQLSWVGDGLKHDDATGTNKTWYLSSKYVLVNDIDMTLPGNDMKPDGFDVYIKTTISAEPTDNLTVSVGYIPDGGQFTTLNVSAGTISVSGVVAGITSLSSEATFTYTADETCEITAEGLTANNADMSMNNKRFVVGWTGIPSNGYISDGIDSNGNFKSIGSYGGTAFSGTFDGNCHVINGLRTVVNPTSYNSMCTGMFEVITSSATIRNIYLEGGSAIGMSSMSQKHVYAGGIVGYVNVTGQNVSTIDISNCYNTGIVSTSVSTSGVAAYSGGIIGRIYIGSPKTMTLSNCYNTGNVSASAASGSTPRAGGVVGDIRTAGTLTMSDCYNMGAISASTKSITSYSGGILGQATALENATFTISNCYNIGTVSASASSTANRGGIIGATSGNTGMKVPVFNCYFLGDGALAMTGSDDMHVTIYDEGQLTTLAVTPDVGSETAAELKTAGTFYDETTTYDIDKTMDGWDFSSSTPIWCIHPLLNDGYPFLLSSMSYSVTAPESGTGFAASVPATIDYGQDCVFTVTLSEGYTKYLPKVSIIGGGDDAELSDGVRGDGEDSNVITYTVTGLTEDFSVNIRAVADSSGDDDGLTTVMIIAIVAVIAIIAIALLYYFVLRK